MQDEQDRAEALDDDKGGDPAPDKPPGAQAYGAAGAEPHAVESVASRAAREEPDVLPVDPEAPVGTDDPSEGALPPDPERAVDPDDRVPTALPDPPPPDPERLVDEADPIMADTDTDLSDFATERAAPRPAEELAVRDVDGRSVDRPDLEEPDDLP